jgi:hypothetical protein
MLRKRLVGVAAAVCLLVVPVVGCSKKDKPEVGGAGATTPTAAVEGAGGPSAAGTANGKDWDKIDRVSFSKLETLLPESANGMKRTGLNGNAVATAYTEAIADYEGPNEATMMFRLRDFPTDAEAKVESKSTLYKGYPVTSERETNDDSAFDLVVGDRFVVSAEGHKVKLAQLKTALEKVDLAKLATWKDEGVKK